MWTAMMTTAMLIGLLIFAAQLQLSLRITRAKTDVPVFNQIFVLCLVFSGRLFFLPTRRNCVIFVFFVPYTLTPPGTATMISLPLNTWIMSLEDQDQEDQQLRQNLCSILAVVSFIIIMTSLFESYTPSSMLFRPGAGVRAGSLWKQLLHRRPPLI